MIEGFLTLLKKESLTPTAELSGLRDAERQKKLNSLCAQRLNKGQLIVSGLFQFLQLSRVKKRLGKKWAHVSKAVYDAVEEVFAKHLDKGDVFMRYNDEVYVLLFAQVSVEAATTKAVVIAEEIQKKLFSLDEKELRNVEIRNAVSELRTSELRNGTFLDFLDSFTVSEDGLYAQTGRI